MISYGDYIAFNKLTSEKEVTDWITDDDIYSNHEHYKSLIKSLITHKNSNLRAYRLKENKKAYRNIYAYEMSIMLPQNLSEEQKHLFVDKFMYCLDFSYKTNAFLYCYKFEEKGNGYYVKIMCFTRRIFRKKQRRKVVYNSNYYFDTVAKRRCTKSNNNAILLHKKGEAKLDENGNVQYAEYYVSPKEKEIFKYKSFSKFIKNLKKIIGYVKQTILKKINNIKLLSHDTAKSSYRGLSKKKIFIKNQMIDRINQRLVPIKESVDWFKFQGNGLYKEFNKLMYKIDQTLNKKNWKEDNFCINLSLYQTFASYQEAILEMEEELEKRINKWVTETFIVPEFGCDIYAMEVI